MSKIPVFSIVKDIYKETFCNPKRYFTLSLLWIGLITICLFFGFQLIQELAVAEFYKMLGYPMPEHDVIQLKVLGFTLSLTILGVFLMGSFTRASMTGVNSLAFDLKSLIFLFKYFVIFVIAMAVVLAVLMIGSPIINDIFLSWEIANGTALICAYAILALIAIALTVFFVIRLFMGLPNTFTKEPVDIKAFWVKTKGQVLRIFSIMLLVAVPSFIISASRLISYTDVDKGISFNMNLFLYESKAAYMVYMILIFLCAPLYGTMLAKVYKALEIEGFVVPKKEKKTDEQKKVEKE